jgi:hypothetical protein
VETDSVAVEQRRLPFTLIENVVLEDQALSGIDVLVYLALAKHADTGGICWPSMATIAKLARVHRATVAEAIKHLEVRGYLKRSARFRPNGGVTSNSYQLLQMTAARHPPVAQDDSPPSPGRHPPVAQDDRNYIHLEPDPMNKREIDLENTRSDALSPSSASLPEKALSEELLALSRETIGSETQYVDQAVKLVRAGEDPNEVKAGFGEMLRRRPAGAPFFAKDYPTHWKPKAKDSQDKAKKRICQSCGKQVTVTSSQCPLCRDPIDGSLKRRREEFKRAEAERAGKDLIALQLSDLKAKAVAGSRFAADRLKRATA